MGTKEIAFKMECVKAIKSKSKEASLERQIIIGMNFSDSFLQKVNKIYHTDFFTSDIHGIISYWITNYFENHNKAPRDNLHQIFYVEKSDFDENTHNTIKTVISRIFEEWEVLKDFNEDYLLEKTKNYFDKRNLIILASKLDDLANKDEIEKAKELRYDIKNDITLENNSFRTVFSDEAIHAVVNRNKKNSVFRFPGKLNNVIKPFKRGNFVVFQAPAKRGKSWWMVYTAYVAMMQGLPFIFFSFEMSKEEVEARIIQCACSLIDYDSDDDPFKEYFPVFDCIKNQTGKCKSKFRTNNVKLVNINEKEQLIYPEIDDTPKGYTPCTACRGNKEGEFEPTSWFEKHSRPSINNFKDAKKEVDKVKKILRTSGLVEFYPRGSFSIQDVETRLDILEYENNFIPAVGIIDYLDISKKSGGEFRHDINSIWEYSDRVAKSRNLILVSGTQGGKASFNKENQSEEDNTEDYRKIANVDQLIAVNQTKREKSMKQWRIATIAKRSGNFNSFMQAKCLQNLSAGQVCLDSEIVFTGDN